MELLEMKAKALEESKGATSPVLDLPRDFRHRPTEVAPFPPPSSSTIDGLRSLLRLLDHALRTHIPHRHL